MRVLVAFEDLRRVYREVFARAIRELRPALTVHSAPLCELENELWRFEPHVVVSSQSSKKQHGRSGAWVHIPTDDAMEDEERLAEICLDGKSWKTDGPPLSELLEVIDEAQERLRDGGLSEAC